MYHIVIFLFTFQEFLKLYPKCMESSRSLYSKLQSVEKDEAKAFITSPVRSNSIDHHQMAPPATPILEKSTSLPEPLKAVQPLTLKPLSEVKIKEEPSENILGKVCDMTLTIF
jgi:hypothetical protein